MSPLRQRPGWVLPIILGCGGLVLGYGLILAAQAPINVPRNAGPPTPAPATAGPWITIYSTADYAQADPPGSYDQQSGYAIVRERRMMQLASGENQRQLTGIPSGIDLSSLSLESPPGADGIALLEHRYLAPPMTPDDVLRSHIGREIIINRRQPGTGEAAARPETINAKLLAFDRTAFVVETNNRQLPIEIIPRSEFITELKLVGPAVQPTTQPAIGCTIRSEQAGPRDVQVMYRTRGISWQCTYNLLTRENDSSADLSGGISITNCSGVSYPPALLRLALSPRDTLETAADEYPLPHPVALPDNSAQQVALFAPRRNLPLSRVYVYRPQAGAEPAHAPARDAAPVDVCLLVPNDKDGPLGTPLPPGRIRVYRAAASDAPPLFLSEQTIPGVPLGGPLLVKLGTTRDILAWRQVISTRQPRPDGSAEVTLNVEIRLHNQSPQAGRVVVLDTLPHPRASIAAASDPIDRQEARQVQFSADVPANGQRKLTYTARYAIPNND